MNKEKIEYYISKERLGKFLANTNDDYIKAEKLYMLNINLSEKFYPILSLLEICLRNSLNVIICNNFSETNWLSKQVNGFMNDTSLSYGNFRLRKILLDVISKLKNPNLTQGKIIAELSFSFWTYLFVPIHYKLLQGVPIKIFKNKPPKINRNDIYRMLNDIRLFRNRIYHYEPVCFVNRLFDTSKTSEIYDNIKNILEWMDKDLLIVLKELDEVDFAIKQINKFERL